MDTKQHWEAVYEGQDPTEVSWFQPRPETSLELIDQLELQPSARIVDVGGGTSTLVDHLLARGSPDITVLDISDRALEQARRRLGPRAERVRWIVCDVTDARFDRPFDLWHDRAVFHFLVDSIDRERYRQRMAAAVVPGGHAIVATFGEDGPERCSGLPVVRYSRDALEREVGEAFVLVDSRRELHRTPSGKDQSFVYCLFRRRH